jgi:competence protein ComEA
MQEGLTFIKALSKISRIIGFTETEIKVILFLISVFCAGLILKEFFGQEMNSTDIEYDYSKSDSAFVEAIKMDGSEAISNKLTEKKVASEQELLDFSTNNLLKNSSSETILAEKSIDINTADISLLKKLPGIGEKTAEKIIDLRDKKGKFTSIEDLLEIKGIGSIKLNKIKKYIFLSD